MNLLKVKPAEDAYAVLDTEPLWTVEEVAKYLRLKQETVRLMARKNQLPALKVGKAWRFRINDVKTVLHITRQG